MTVMLALLAQAMEPDRGAAAWIVAGIVALLGWAAVPMVIAGSVAASRGRSMRVAMVLTFFLSWIGLVIVVLGMRDRRSPAERAAAGADGATPGAGG